MPQQYSQNILIVFIPALTNGPVVPRSLHIQAVVVVLVVSCVGCRVTVCVFTQTNGCLRM